MTDRLLLDLRGAADVLTMSTRSVERLAASGELPSLRVGRLRRFRFADLVAFVDALGDNGAAAGLAPAAALDGGQVRGRRHRGS